MSYDRSDIALPAPCLIDSGIVINKQDMRRLLASLSRVRYEHKQDKQLQSQGEGYVLEVFSDPHQATLIANGAIYLNVHSFDYLEMGTTEGDETSYFELVQEDRQLRLVPLSNPLQEQATQTLNAAALEAMMTQVLSAGWDAQFDDEDGDCSL